jgi:membrane protease YdiL (CAAX protease family)
MMPIDKPIKTISTFLVITTLLSALFYFLIGTAGSINAAENRYVYGLMWSPGIAALLTCWFYNRNPSTLGWKWPGFKYQLMAYIIPPLYVLVAYIPIWLSGLGLFGNEEFLNSMIIKFGNGWQHIPQPLFIGWYIITTATTLFASSCASALGEEIGWRGLLAPELCKITSFGKASLLGGIIWAVWHFPLIILANYNGGTPTWYSLLCFTLMVIGLSFLYTWTRLKTGSIWPTIFLHASHNLFIGKIFDSITGDTGYTKFFIGEFGVALIVPIACIALFCWIKSKKIKSEVKVNNVFLNHLNTIIDENTYDEIKKSDFLKNEFCHCQERANSGAPAGVMLSWTGFYLTGENTYIELFNKKDEKNLHAIEVGNVGLGFSVDQKEEIEKIIELFKQKFANNVTHGLYKKNIDNILVPWFHYVVITNMLPQFDAWIMAYHKDYCKKLNADSITRKDYNKKYNTTPFDENKLFKDIEEVTLLLNDEIKRKFIERQLLLGYTCQEAEGYTICRGPDITFIMKPSKNQTCKLSKLKMSLNHKTNNVQNYKLGNSTLELENKTAIWTFK